jgi:Xaa-Pro aminopeptidase
MATTQKPAASVPAPPPSADPKTYYQQLFDALGEAYWAASDLDAKDQIQGARDAVHEILTAITQAQLDKDTTELVKLGPAVDKTNVALKKLKDDINNIVKKIQVAAAIENAIAKVLSLAGKLT